jgi:hypothetical protein
MTDDATLRAAALESKAWPYEEARKLVKRYPDGKPDGSPMLFETGYGPSGLPHIGTFQEVLRTTMVRHAYEEMTGHKTRLVAFSDDMDGLRKVPDNVPNQALLAAHLGKPLSRIPDPFEKFDSFAAHNNAMLRDFLDRFGFEYEFVSSTNYYEGRPLRREAEGRAAQLCRDHGGDAADAARRAAGDLFAGAAGEPEERRGAAGAGGSGRCRGGDHPLRG